MYKFVITESFFNSLAEQERAPYNTNRPTSSTMNPDAINAKNFIDTIKSDKFKAKLVENYNDAIGDWIFYNYHSDKEQYKQAKLSFDDYLEMSLSDFLGYVIDITLDDFDLIWYELYREPDTEKIPYSYILGFTNDTINKKRPDKRVEASISIRLKEEYSRKLDKAMLYFEFFTKEHLSDGLDINENNIEVTIELIEEIDIIDEQDDINFNIWHHRLLNDKKGKPPIEESLRKWLNQKWTRVEFKDGKRVYKPCGESKAQSNPARCKPKKKWASMSNDEIKKDRAKKKRGGREGKQFVSATKKGKVKANYL